MGGGGPSSLLMFKEGPITSTPAPPCLTSEQLRSPQSLPLRGGVSEGSELSTVRLIMISLVHID